MPVRQWAAILLADALTLPRDHYLAVATKLAEDEEPIVRDALMESLVWHDAREDLKWAEVAPIIKSLL